jgi:hypothetical protein
MIITMTTYRRPDYTRQVLDALARCRGIGNCRLLVACEPGHPEVVAAFNGWDACYIHLKVNEKRRGLNKNTRTVLSRALELQPDYLLHIEDDTVLSPDALEYYQWALNESRKHADVFSVAGYNKPDKPPAPADVKLAAKRKWFTCWGWAVTGKRLAEILQHWSAANPKSFAWHLNKKVRAGRFEIYPKLSRVQNIGYEKGENDRTAAWYRENHRTPYVATSSVTGAWRLE